MSQLRFVEIAAKRLAVGDKFLPAELIGEAKSEGWFWIVVEHEFTERGDYSTIVDSDGCTWTERFGPDDLVVLVEEDG